MLESNPDDAAIQSQLKEILEKPDGVETKTVVDTTNTVVENKDGVEEKKETVETKEVSQPSVPETVEITPDANAAGLAAVLSGEIPQVDDKIVENMPLGEIPVVETKEAVVENVVNTLFDDGWFDEITGKVDETKIKDEKVKDAIKTVVNKFNNDRKLEKIGIAVDSELAKNYALNVTPETLKKMLDMSGVTVGEDGAVVGVKESIEALKTAEPGLFKDKAVMDNPLLQDGFNPVTKKSTGKPTSWESAFRMMDEISS